MSRTSILSRVVSIIFFVVIALSFAPLAWADTFGNYEYTLSNGEATIIKYKGSDSVVIIPSEFYGHPVTSIGDDAFANTGNLTSRNAIVLPNTIKSIGDRAFYNIPYLRSVTVPESVISIGNYAFADLASPSAVNVPNERIAALCEGKYTEGKTEVRIIPPDTSLWNGVESTTWTEGDGTEDDPYIIDSAAKFAYLRDTVNSGSTTGEYAGVFFRQTVDIDLGFHNWTPIGCHYNFSAASSHYSSFNGHYDGGGHSIAGLYASTGRDSGLFIWIRGSKDQRASLSGLTVSGFVYGGVATVNDHVGGLVAYCNYVDISNCGNDATVKSQSRYCGGIVSSCEETTINACYNHGEVNSVFSDNAQSPYGYAAGIVSSLQSGETGGTVTNCYNTGFISSMHESGGIAGTVSNSKYGCVFENSYNVGTVEARGSSAKTRAGGLFGQFGSSSSTASTVPQLNNCYSLKGSAPSDYASQGNPEPYMVDCAILTSDYMKSSDFVQTLGSAYVQGDTYPKLYWEKSSSSQTDIAGAVVAPIPDQTYTGSTIEPQITVAYDGANLVAGEDYDVAFSNNIEVGIATVTITGKGAYTGSKTVAFAIVEASPEPISIESATIAPIPDQAYTGSAITPKLSVTYEGNELVDGTDYTVTFVNNVNPGTALVIVAGKGNYTGSTGASFTITPPPIDIADAAVAPIEDQVYTGSPITPELTVTFEDEVLVNGEDYEVSFINNIDLGTAIVIVTGKGGYTGTTGTTFKIIEAAPAGPVKFDGTPYRIVSKSDPDFILDVAEVHPTAGANVSIWTSNGGLNQLFTFEESDDGYVILRNVANDELVLDAAGATPEIGANVSTWSFNNGMNQKWTLIPSEEAPGYFSIASASNSDFVLDAAGAVPEIGANVSIWSSNGGDNQLWTFVEANDLAYAEVASIGMARNHTGSALSPDISVILNGEGLSEGDDYSVLFDGAEGAPSEAGVYEVAIIGTGDYSGVLGLGEFRIYDGPEVAEGVSYHLASGFSDEFVLDVAEVMPTIGANVSIWIDNGGLNQLFTMELLDDGFYVLRNVANPELVLDAAGAEPSVGANVSTWSFNDGMNQKWVLIPSDTMPGYYRIASASNITFVLDAAGAEPEIGANVSIWVDNDGKNQLWKLVSPHDYPPIPEDIGEAYRIASAADTSFVLEMTELSEGANVAIWMNGIGAKQAFIVEKAEDTGYVIRNAVYSELVIEVVGSTPQIGANVVVGEYNGGSNQKWFLRPTDDGFVTIVSVANPEIVFDAAGAIPKAGANVSTWTYNGGTNQKWVLMPIE